MKLDKIYLNKCYHDAMILQYKQELKNEGFLTESEKIFDFNGKRFKVDLYAVKDGEKRIYEFRIVGKGRFQKGIITKFKEFAESTNAKPYVVYVKPPIEKQIIFEELDQIISGYFIEEGIPSELDVLSTHTTIDYIEVNEILSVAIEKSLITVSGEAIVYVNLQYGSDRDCEYGDGAEYSDSFPLTFTVELDCDHNIKTIKYEVDTSNWYE
ncbi:hypothetical protein [Desulfuribacillus alkaliarsenatis]|uniref:Predicted pPIWI-associating nuclease group 2 domain-containing protein n=1 Tax=Desulfuribacillus alkaliarsenatis TaxID=766136 RepID=A0A1E5G531_9FIRM|nr:hypothetical protein [Desulfuribacillus alkaliarsenatis]OEF98276.1 hypothetical protein BHF68_00915 [Desulfuribacillus alkaliarsenatis]